MNYKDNAVEQYYSLNPAQFGFLESLKLDRGFNDEEHSDYTLELKLRSHPDRKDRRMLDLSFTGVKDLKIGDLDGLMNLFIDIRSVYEHQLENLRYKIAENENDAFSFFCKDFKAVIK